MSLLRQPIPPVPAVTAHVARLAFPAGNVYMQMRDALGSIYEDDLFADVYAGEGQPAIHPWQLALVSVMQFAENLSDRQAAEAVRARIDWKYVLSLDLTESGFHYSVLSEFRTRLVQGSLEQLLLDKLLECCQQRGWLKARGRQRTDSTHVVGAVKVLNQLELVGETLRHTLNVLATVVPEWLKQKVKPEWFDRYGERVEDYRLPKDKTEREHLSRVIGEDGYHLLDCIEQAQALAWLKQLPAVQVFVQVWEQQYRRDQGHVQRLTPKDMLPVGEWIRSPYDSEVRYGKKRDFDWVGYKVHLTECCDDNLPHLITQVETVPAIEQDHHALAPIQADLAAKDLLPTQQLVDAGYVSAKRILHSRDVHAIDLIGPVHSDPSWQARTPGAVDVAQFHIDWEGHQATCPQGQRSSTWHFGQDAKGESIVQILFAKQTCQACPIRELCTDARTSGRSMTVRYPPERHEMLQRARLRQQTESFKILYRGRAGIEGTISQATRNTGLRRSRYIGRRKTHLQHLLTAVATNILRLVQWRSGVPFAKTRISRFAALAA
ncbi:MAG TPA: IS1182 family transposase [Ktedonobacterales bacterium]